MAHPPALVVSLPSPRDHHDQVVLLTVAPVIQTLRSAPALDAVWFERVNKPDWGVRVLVTGEPGWLAGEAQGILADGLGVADGAAEFTADEPDDKWTGGIGERESLMAFHHEDTHACLEALECDRAERLGSRALFNLLVVEGLLDALGLQDEARLAFYRRSFEWAVANGRWDAEVRAALEKTFAKQRDSLVATLDARDDGEPGRWPSPDAARIGRALLESVRTSLPSSAFDPVERATFAAHAHSNRLGLHASNEATLRYLVSRARGGPALCP